MSRHFLSPLLRATASCGLRIDRTGAWLAGEVARAFDSDSRRKGLLGSDALCAQRALVIAPTQGVHTFGMQYPLDIVAVARDGRVVKLRTHVPPRRLVFALRAFAFIELAAGAIERSGVREGDRVSVRISPAKHS